MTDLSPQHTPVMVDELLEALALEQSHTVIDATYGFGGHAAAVLEELGPDGQLIGFERDPEVYERVRASADDPRLTLVNANYRYMDERLPEGVGEVDSVYFDLGVSSFHFDTSDRGFSFRRDDDVLDCRFNPEGNAPTAAEVINRSTPDDLRSIMADYGEVRNMQAVVGSILEDRPLETVGELRKTVEKAVPHREQSGELARVFQALRIYVNAELESLEDGLEKALDLLPAGGRLAVISYHSLEDRRVKEFFRYQEKECVCPPDLPVCACDKTRRLVVGDRSPITPNQEEIEENPRARSAMLRVAAAVGSG